MTYRDGPISYEEYEEYIRHNVFMTKKDLKEYAKEFIYKDPPTIIDNLPAKSDPVEDVEKYSKNMIMSYNFCRPLNSRKLIGNNNVLVVGDVGTNKLNSFIKPNILQMNASYVITDPSGKIIFSLGKTLKDHGYKIKIFNILDMTYSNYYNPLHYIHNEEDVNILIQCLISNTTPSKGREDDQFFVDAEKLLYSACIYYLLNFCDDDTKKNLTEVMKMIKTSLINEQDTNDKSKLDVLFDELPKDSLTWRFYKAFKLASNKNLKAVVISCIIRLQQFMIPQVANLIRKDDLELEKIGDEKTALFIITPQANRTYSFLASMLYSQLFETLYHIGEQQKANGEKAQLHIPVRCIMNDFINVGEIPELPAKLATMRKYNISVAIILQNISQIEDTYKDDWKILANNCTTNIFFGSQEPNTLKYFSKLLEHMIWTDTSMNKITTLTPDDLKNIPSNECIVHTFNFRPVKDLKYKYETHPYYSQTADANNDYAFCYDKLPEYDITQTKNI